MFAPFKRFIPKVQKKKNKNNANLVICFLLLLLLAFSSVLFGVLFSQSKKQQRAIDMIESQSGALRFENVGNGIGVHLTDADFVTFCDSSTVIVMLDAMSNIFFQLRQISDASLTYFLNPFVSIDVFGRVRVNESGNVTEAFIETINGMTTEVTLLGGHNVRTQLMNASSIDVATTRAVTFENVNVSSGMSFVGNISCTRPFGPDCLDISGASCSNPLMQTCFPSDLYAQHIHTTTLFLMDNEVEQGALADQFQLNVSMLIINDLTLAPEIECAEPWSHECWSINRPIGSECVVNDDIMSTLTVSSNIQFPAAVQCMGQPLPATCVNLTGLACSSRLDQSCLPERINSLNGFSGNVLLIGQGLISVDFATLQITTEAEINIGNSLGSGVPVYAGKSASVLEFRNVDSLDGSISVVDPLILDVVPTGVLAGRYTAPTISLNAQGRITNAMSNSVGIEEIQNTGGAGVPLVATNASNAASFELRSIEPNAYLDTRQETDGTLVFDLPVTGAPTGGTAFGDDNNVAVVTLNDHGFVENLSAIQVDKGGLGSCAISAVSANRPAGILTFDSVIYSNSCPPGAWDNTTFVAPQEGIYSFSCFCKTIPVATNKVQLFRNGVQVLVSYSVSGFSDNIMVLQELQVGDALWFTKSSGATPSKCHMEITSLY